MSDEMQRTLTTTRRQDNRRARSAPALPVPAWVVMSDTARLADPAPIIPYLPPGSAVIVRHPDPETASDMARSLIGLARAHSVTLLISAAVPPTRLDADGVHIPEAALSNWKASDLARLRPGFVSVSAHSLRAARRAWHMGADTVLLSPVFATDSHKGTASLGLPRFATIANAAGLPVIALGGVTEKRIRRVLAAGAAGVAGIGLFTAAINSAKSGGFQ